jgi:hypothetical protein
MASEQITDSLVVTCFASATAGLVGRSLCHPFDTLKAKLQLSESQQRIMSIARTTWSNEGIRGFYRGLGAVLAGGVPGVCIYITTYETTKARIQQNPFYQKYPFWTYAFSGMFAEAIWLAYICIEAIMY